MKIQALFAQKEKIEGPEISYKHIINSLKATKMSVW
jgi:hypothetical protein